VGDSSQDAPVRPEIELGELMLVDLNLLPMNVDSERFPRISMMAPEDCLCAVAW